MLALLLSALSLAAPAQPPRCASGAGSGAAVLLPDRRKLMVTVCPPGAPPAQFLALGSLRALVDDPRWPGPPWEARSGGPAVRSGSGELLLVPVVLERKDSGEERLAVATVGALDKLGIAFVGDPVARGGLGYLLADLDGDGKPELHLALRPPGGEAKLRTFALENGALSAEWKGRVRGPAGAAAQLLCEGFAFDEGFKCDALLDARITEVRVKGGTLVFAEARPTLCGSGGCAISAVLVPSKGPPRLVLQEFGGLRLLPAPPGKPPCLRIAGRDGSTRLCWNGKSY